MRKSTIFGALLSAAALWGFGAVESVAQVTPADLPAGVTSVQPPQGIVNLDGEVSPLGAGSVTVYFSTAPEKNPAAAKLDVAIYKVGEDTPLETVKCSTASVDAMGQSAGMITFKGDYTKKGEYKIVIPAGCWLLAGAPSPEITLFYEITRDYLVNPAGIVEAPFKEFELIFPSAQFAQYNGSGVQFYMEGTTENIPLSIAVVPPSIDGEETNTFLVTINGGNGVSEPGIYTFKCQAGAFDIIWWDPAMEGDLSKGRQLKSDIMDIKFTIPEMPEPSIEPADGSKLIAFTTFKCVMPHVDDYSFLLGDNMVRNYIYPASDEWVKGNLYTAIYKMEFHPESTPGAGDSYTFNNKTGEFTLANEDGDEEFIPAPGNYILKLGAGLYSGQNKNGKFCNSAAYEYRYTIILDPTVYEVATEAGEYDSLETIEVNFPNAVYVLPNEAEDAPQVTLKNEEGENFINLFELSSGISVNDDDFGGAGDDDFGGVDDEYSGASVKYVTENPLVQKGVYTFNMPAGAFLCDDYDSPEINVVYTISGETDGVKDVVVVNDKVDVYTTTGVRVLNNANVDALSTLQKGIYIVNGQKMVIR